MSVNDNDERLETAFDPPTPQTPPRRPTWHDTAREFESALNATAKKLGLQLRVTYCAQDFCFRFEAALILDRAWHAVDEAIYMHGGKALSELTADILEDLQLRLHDLARKQMQERDVRQRTFILSKEDKHTLHDMFMAASAEELRDFARAENGCKKVDKYQELMNRLFR